MEGLWFAHFTAGTTQGDGLAVLHNGEILGGDQSHIYKGTYKQDGASLYANVFVNPFDGWRTPDLTEYPMTVFLMGSIKGNIASLSGHPDSHPDWKISVELHKGA